MTGYRDTPLLYVCESLRRELTEVAPDPGLMDVEYLDLGYHRQPLLLPEFLGQQLEQQVDRPYILLALGLCSRAVLGVSAPRHRLVLPRVHDCVALFLGGQERYQRVLEENPRRFFLTSGWLDSAQEPLGQFREWQERFDRDTAQWLFQELYGHFDQLTVVDTGVFLPWHWERARAVAEFTGLPLDVLTGDLGLLARLLYGPWDESILVLPPGQVITGAEFECSQPEKEI